MVQGYKQVGSTCRGLHPSTTLNQTLCHFHTHPIMWLGKERAVFEFNYRTIHVYKQCNATDAHKQKLLGASVQMLRPVVATLTKIAQKTPRHIF